MSVLIIHVVYLLVFKVKEMRVFLCTVYENACVCILILQLLSVIINTKKKMKWLSCEQICLCIERKYDCIRTQY